MDDKKLLERGKDYYKKPTKITQRNRKEESLIGCSECNGVNLEEIINVDPKYLSDIGCKIYMCKNCGRYNFINLVGAIM